MQVKGTTAHAYSERGFRISSKQHLHSTHHLAEDVNEVKFKNIILLNYS